MAGKSLESEFAKVLRPGGLDMALAGDIVAGAWKGRSGYPAAEQCTRMLADWAVDWGELQGIEAEDAATALAKAAATMIDRKRVTALLRERYAKWGERVARHVRRVWAEEDAQEAITRKSQKVARQQDPQAFAAAVRQAAERPTTRKFGPDKAFIASVFDSFGRKVSKQDFVRQLLEAHRSGRLSLARADLVGAMDPRLVAASEVRDPQTGASYHFVRLQKEAPQRASGFAQDFEAAYRRLDPGSGLVFLSELRQALPGYTRGEFDRGLADLRRRRRFTAGRYEGRSGLLTPEQRAGAIVEAGDHLHWVKRID